VFEGGAHDLPTLVSFMGEGAGGRLRQFLALTPTPSQWAYHYPYVLPPLVREDAGVGRVLTWPYRTGEGECPGLRLALWHLWGRV
jgi:hypothetical protein